jgi:hypothetical protein
MIESALGKLGKALDRWCGSRLIYNDIPGCPVPYYGEINGQVRGGIGLVDFAVAYTEITGAVHFIPWEDVPTEGRRGMKKAIGAMPRTRSFQQLVIFARTKGYKPTNIARKVGVSDETVSKWIKGESEPGDENWERIKQFKEQLMAAPTRDAEEVDKEQADALIEKIVKKKYRRRKTSDE